MSDYKVLENSYVPITAKSHDSQGTVTWQSEDGQKYISANSNANTPLLFDPGYKTAGKLSHETGSYYLQTSCSQRGSCAGGCRCNDCPQQFGTNEDMDTAARGDFLKKVANGAAQAAAAAKKGIEAARVAAQRGIEAVQNAHEQGKKVLAAAKHAAKEFQEQHAKLKEEGHAPAAIQEGTKKHKEHMQKCVDDAKQTLEDLETAHTDDISQEEKTENERLQQELKTVVSHMQQLLEDARG
jgi:hypothetical protein